MERNKVSKNGKSILLDNGVELTYCEFGEENEEVLISGAFYFHTWTPVLEALAEKYHVYGIVMRFDGVGTQLHENGDIHWGKQWGDDVYQFAAAMGIDKFHYVGKCHGVTPGWYMLKNHQAMIETFCSFFLSPQLLEPNSDQWTEIPAKYGQMEHVKRTMRKEESLPIKMAELQSLGPMQNIQSVAAYANCPEQFWDTKEECEEFLKSLQTPICMMFGTDDILFQDYFDSSIYAMKIINRAKTVILQGERHLMEIDCPLRVASEAIFFIEESKKPY